jgi:hypothetical protein
MSISFRSIVFSVIIDAVFVCKLFSMDSPSSILKQVLSSGD